jgi:hypothetical protein
MMDASQQTEAVYMWNDDKRKRQAENCKKTAPWRLSTGPRSAEGKVRVSQNAIKHNLRGGVLRRAAELIAKSNKLLKEMNHE